MKISDAPSIDVAEAPAGGPVQDPGIGHNGIGHNRASIADIFRDRYASLIERVEKIAARASTERQKLQGDQIANDNERDSFIALGTEVAKIVKEVDRSREDEVATLRDETNQWNKLFGASAPVEGSLKHRLGKIKAFAQDRVDAYRERQAEAERRRLAEVAERFRAEEARKMAEAESLADRPIHSDIALGEAAAADHRASHAERQALATRAEPVRTDSGTAFSTGRWTFRVTDRSKIDLNKVPFSLAEIEAALGRHAREHRDSMPIAGVEFYRETKTQFRG